MKNDNARVIMKGGKAENLAILAKIPKINVPKFTVIRPEISKSKRKEIINDFLNSCRPLFVAVRSSVTQEDSISASFAGMYLTKLRVPATLQKVLQAVDEVIASVKAKHDVASRYAATRGVEFTGETSVIVQEMIEATMGGVVFSHDLMRQDGYYLVSVSCKTGESIVSGVSTGTLVRVVRRMNPENICEKWLQKIIKTMKSIEEYYRSTSLDVEFAFRGDTLYTLQCRPITAVQKVLIKETEEEKLLKRIMSLNELIASCYRGDVLGDMIDINPVELLGASPTPLDTSIFKHLFADQIVEQVRREMGYDPLDVGLIRVVGGKPYVSMHASAFSFRPQGIPRRIYERIVKVYRDMLVKNPALQNRVEFEVFAMSCGEKLEQVMVKAKLNKDEKRIVRDAFNRLDSTFLEISKEELRIWKRKAYEYEKSLQDLQDGDASLESILEYVATGTKMFTKVARLAFYWKNKFEEIHPQENLNELLTGHIHSVNTQLQIDLVRCRKGVITREELIQRYKHLHPGQFSVFGESYEDDPEYYLLAQMEKVKAVKILKRSHVFEDTTEFRYVVSFMEAREQINFLFNKAFHFFTTKLKKLLVQFGISQKDASRLSWEQLKRWLDGTPPKTSEETEPPILLPEVIIPGITDLRVIMFSEAMPTYVTNQVIKAPLCVLERPSIAMDVRDAIVILPNADPGYDFLFHSGVAGIITKVGGPASHMCIRAVELQIPACIGCGERMYQKLKSARTAILDCKSEQIII